MPCLTEAHVQVERMNGVVRVNKNLSVSRAIGDAGVRGLLLPPLLLSTLLSRSAASSSFP